ncbi:hypothetical protein BGZ99_003735 [Dissophora globulifera]|uniref:Uncharacterized protein n=1 Tax=Dissophora globulifera TaxID=979702 RepID=A0A9P6RJQ5_9FUNG|nr:hypothetical protein BGZ99_003735 [Dissophora globulifera]
MTLSSAVMAHTLDLDLYTYFDVKIAPEAVDQVLAVTRTAAAVENGTLAGVEYLGHVGSLDNHLLYRVPRYGQTSDNNGVSTPVHSQYDDSLEEQRNRQIVDAISALQGVLHVDVQTLRQRAKRDEL